MVRLEILDIANFGTYTLYNREQNKEYHLMLEFHDIPQPEIDDVIFLHEALLDPTSTIYTQPYSFGALDSAHGREMRVLDKTEIIKLKLKGQDVILKRIYG